MNAILAKRVAHLEAERARPIPRLSKPDPNAPYTPQQQAQHRAEALADVYGTATRTHTETR
ncbi:hypothetical protein Caci_3021 [Catenulispora acidiphila DSM 44928]|uniref:Uncharacterized protein n=1 Tax=Catenulispora acidiphila (strain DSM 44928 / JCM 14897 / NBRC 102108 / NRRL B-24433 / ID139908) TaxID=479433 RepID=C7Q4G1_CATAD|nr:hypothetical protein [Catenulispora acidiphila]ACU71930.1 hypothetical protein Caci_3021 [Catenulispora acidiphila DSM 44928]